MNNIKALGLWNIELSKYGIINDSEIAKYFIDLKKQADEIIEKINANNFYGSLAKLLGIESKCRCLYLIIKNRDLYSYMLDDRPMLEYFIKNNYKELYVDTILSELDDLDKNSIIFSIE